MSEHEPRQAQLEDAESVRLFCDTFTAMHEAAVEAINTEEYPRDKPAEVVFMSETHTVTLHVPASSVALGALRRRLNPLKRRGDVSATVVVRSKDEPPVELTFMANRGTRHNPSSARLTGTIPVPIQDTRGEWPQGIDEGWRHFQFIKEREDPLPVTRPEALRRALGLLAQTSSQSTLISVEAPGQNYPDLTFKGSEIATSEAIITPFLEAAMSQFEPTIVPSDMLGAYLNLHEALRISNELDGESVYQIEVRHGSATTTIVLTPPEEGSTLPPLHIVREILPGPDGNIRYTFLDDMRRGIPLSREQRIELLSVLDSELQDNIGQFSKVFTERDAMLPSQEVLAACDQLLNGTNEWQGQVAVDTEDGSRSFLVKLCKVGEKYTCLVDLAIPLEKVLFTLTKQHVSTAGLSTINTTKLLFCLYEELVRQAKQ